MLGAMSIIRAFEGVLSSQGRQGGQGALEEVVIEGRHSHLNVLVLRFNQELTSGSENLPLKHSNKKPRAI